jgi:hypothetical protein
MARAAYLVELREAIATGKIREKPEYGILEVREEVQVPVFWKEKIKRKKKDGTVVISWKDCQGVATYTPGQVLFPYWRQASEWEIKEWEGLSGGELKLRGVARKNGSFSVQIVSKIKDLPAAVRQRVRHIPSDLIAREVSEFVVPGDAQIIADFARRLNRLVDEFLRTPKYNSELVNRASRELRQTYAILEKARTALKRKAMADIDSANGSSFFEIPFVTSATVTDLLAQRALDYEMAAKSLSLGEKWLSLMNEIEIIFRNAYERLGELAEELGKEEVGPTRLLDIAREAHGIWLHLNQTVHFDPYYKRLREDDFQRLGNVVRYAEAGKNNTVFNLIKRAAAKLEAVAIGEKVSIGEVQKRREIFT